ncbi:MAG: nucleoside triphosphate pyrophosphohydrolase [Anaerolineae bacterium]|nr:nucleoside triphosphate pyrophosphohydrolase [Anaerolineae bacterium]MDW8067917.1 nucleoside triphosphate pyrophosphohydrolase [Anaerolineae bacterium]
MDVTIVGLGPGDPRHLTREAWEVLSAGQEVWLRTACHPTVAHLPAHLTLRSFDDLYESAEHFAQVYRAIVERVLELARRPGGVIYAVPGHPMVGEATVRQILQAAREVGLSVRLVEGLSFVEVVLTALERDALEPGLQVYDGIEMAALHHPPLNPDLPALIAQVYSRRLASDLKLTLMNQYPDEHPVTLIIAAGTETQRLIHLPLYELDRQEVDHLTTLYVPPLSPVSSFEGFQETIARLRAPDGCPWDREQTHESLRSNLLEEAYEVVAAIDAGDMPSLREELGDLLLQVVLHAQMATEAGEFRMADIIAAVDRKLKGRHPHVWGNQKVKGAQEVLIRWEHLKREEREGKGSLLDSVPQAVPALLQAHIYGKRVARVGFDWARPEEVARKVREEIAEVEAARTPEEMEAEVGDLLFAVANWARHLGVDPETALRKANARFARRFRAMEALASQRGLNMSQMEITELDRLWEEVKEFPNPGEDDGQEAKAPSNL